MRKKGKFFLQIWIFFCIFVAIFDRYVWKNQKFAYKNTHKCKINEA